MHRGWVVLVVVGVLFLSPAVAQTGAPQCFQMFSGVYIQFNKPVTTTITAQNGRVWGSLASCAGLSSWPVVGSSHLSKVDGLVLGFRAFTVDAANCGAVDFIATLSGNPLSGPFQLWNERKGGGNSGTMTQISCPLPPVEQPLLLGVDIFGNRVK
jgi:hypothetical protein